MKQLMLGNAAIARGIYEAGCRFVSSYPGTPSTEITEEVAKYPEVYAEWAPNEKCALEAAIGASVAGARSFCAMKHVGMNVAADPLFTASYTGVNGGLVVCVADDPGMHSSQNEQDSRNYALAANVPMLEPADSEECRTFTKAAFILSEQFDTPVLLRSCTRIAHAQSAVETEERRDLTMFAYEKNPKKYVMAPANAVAAHERVDRRFYRLQQYAETTRLNSIEWGDSIGIVTAGTCYQYVKEAFPTASVLKLGMVYPLCIEKIRDFRNHVKTLYVIEELVPFLESQIRAAGIRVDGGTDQLGRLGEFSVRRIRETFGLPVPETRSLSEALPIRPPVLCPGCPHRGLFYVLNKRKLTVLGDIGCYTLGSMAPLSAMDTTVCMGASIGMVHGFNQVRPESAKNTVAVIGDSTFMHSGITGLVNVVYNKGVSTVLILDNSITGMTGHQQNPTTGLTLKEEPTYAIRIEDICRAVGIQDVQIVDPQELEALDTALEHALATEAPSVLIVRRPCRLLKSVKAEPPLCVDTEQCRGCKACMRIGCPAILLENGKAHIDPTLCAGCGLCQKLCKFGAIGGAKQ